MKETIHKIFIIALSFHLFACDGAKEEEKLEQESEAYANQLSLNVDLIAPMQWPQGVPWGPSYAFKVQK